MAARTPGGTTVEVTPTTAVLHGWGRSSRSVSTVRAGVPGRDTVLAPAGRGLLARGAGRGYGDAALNSGGTVIQLPAGTGGIQIDGATREAEVDAPVSMGALLEAALAEGLLPPVLPGTRHATVGGAVAADVHGKNHPSAGSFGAHLTRLTVLTASGETVELTTDDPRFGCTVGGLGLTGVILRARVRLGPLPGRWVTTQRRRAKDLDDVLALLCGHGDAVAWLDGHRTGAELGRGLVDLHSFHPSPVDARQLPAEPPRRSPGSLDRPAGGWLPALTGRLPGPGVMHPAAVGALNALLWNRSGDTEQTRPVAAALFPLDRAEGWPGLFGRRGLVQYQIAVPPDRVDLLAGTLETLARRGCPPALATVKRFGAPLPGAALSFPVPGWTLALDLPAASPGLGPLLDRLDDDLAAAGGRVYLVKDSRLRPEHLPVMYPDLDRWRAVRDGMDPDRRFRSDLDRRLDLVTGRTRPRTGSARAVTR
jgi:decaprenylphospho-beta-D-ribofuranose 2-oxidase